MSSDEPSGGAGKQARSVRRSPSTISCAGRHCGGPKLAKRSAAASTKDRSAGTAGRIFIGGASGRRVYRNI